MGCSGQAKAAAQAGSGDSVIGWKLDRDQRRELLQQFPPRFDNVVADHVTLAARVRAPAFHGKRRGVARATRASPLRPGVSSTIEKRPIIR